MNLAVSQTLNDDSARKYCHEYYDSTSINWKYSYHSGSLRDGPWQRLSDEPEGSNGRVRWQCTIYGIYMKNMKLDQGTRLLKIPKLVTVISSSPPSRGACFTTCILTYDSIYRRSIGQCSTLRAHNHRVIHYAWAVEVIHSLS
jgi:hypothetical protein